eukprot:13641296-Alexandrium_andersonii.AAC.1
MPSCLRDGAPACLHIGQCIVHSGPSEQVAGVIRKSVFPCSRGCVSCMPRSSGCSCQCHPAQLAGVSTCTS